MRVAYCQEFQGICIDISLFTEDYQSFYPFQFFCTGCDSQINKALRVVLRLDLQDTVSRCTDVSTYQSDISQQRSCFCCDQILVEYDHSLLRFQIHVSDSLCIITYRNILNACCELFIAVNACTPAAVNNCLCDLFQEAQIVFRVDSLVQEINVLHVIFRIY